MTISYLKTVHLLHNLSQFVARVSQAFVAPLPDFSHTSLGWESNTGHLTGQLFKAPHGRFSLAIQVDTLSVLLLDEKMQPHREIVTKGLHDSALMETIRTWIYEIGLNGALVEEKLPFVIPAYGPGITSPYPEPDPVAILEWKKNRDLAQHTLLHLVTAFPVKSEVRIWPHHFDMAVSLPLSLDENGLPTRSIGAGLAIADELLDESYFYVSGWSAKGALPYDSKPNLTYGYWYVHDNWKGALLPYWEWNAFSNPRERVETFFDEVGNWMQKELTGDNLIKTPPSSK